MEAVHGGSMRVIIAGSRTITDYQLLLKIINQCSFKNYITEIVSGGAKGVDKLGEKYAKENGIPIKYFIPDWSKGKHAGLVRNNEMAHYADALIVLWDGTSKGTKSTIAEMQRLGKPVALKILGV